MNTPRKNHDFFSCQEAPTPRNEVEVIALKSVLLYCLKCFLASQYEEEEDSFIDFSQNRKASLLPDPAQIKNRDLSWDKIPLHRRYSSTEVLYVSALPQLFEKDFLPRTSSDNCALIVQETTRCFTKHLQVFQRKSLISNSFFTEETLSVFSTLWRSFKIESERPGWISFRLSNQGIYAWINQLQNISHLADSDHTLVIKKLLSKPTENYSILGMANRNQKRYSKARIDELMWQVQYTHARCCSLMRSLNVVSMERGSLTRKTEKTRQEGDLPALKLMFDAEKTTSSYQLMQSLIATVDDMFWLPEQYPHKQYFVLLKRAEQLNFAFEQFHRDHTLMPSASQQHLYLTLLAGTRNLIKLLLCRYLQASAPSQL